LVSNEELPTPLLIGCLLAMHLIIVLDPLWVLSRISGNMRRDMMAIDESEGFFWLWPRYVDELRCGQSPAPRIAVARMADPVIRQGGHGGAHRSSKPSLWRHSRFRQRIR
jgi:hypothetical protein